MYQQLHCTTHTAHAPHTCDACGEPIQAGTRYVSLAAVIDGKFTATKTHFENCPLLESDSWDEEHEETRYFHRATDDWRSEVNWLSRGAQS
jgi:hypothetical protein